MRRLSSSRSAATVVLVLLAGCSDQSMTVQPKNTT